MNMVPATAHFCSNPSLQSNQDTQEVSERMEFPGLFQGHDPMAKDLPSDPTSLTDTEDKSSLKSPQTLREHQLITKEHPTQGSF